MKGELPPQLAAIFEALVEEAAGLHYPDRDQALFASKITAQAAEAGYEALLDYYYRLRYDDEQGVELRALLESLVVHETYFFREIGPLRELVKHLASVVKKRGHARVWSAACSSGEEPLTLAMLLDQADLLDRVEIVASDLSEAAIQRARTGHHRRRTVREPYPAELAAEYLVIGERGVTSSQRLRDHVKFRVLNLLDQEGIEALGQFDAILCRNVLIYFRDSSIARIVDRITRSLNPGGLVAVGVAESLLRFGTSLACEERGGSFFYRSAS